VSLILDFKNNHTAYWGKLYRAAELKPEWRVPTAEDVNMAFEIIAIADQSAIKVGQLVEHKAFGDKMWTNDFCRSLHVINQVLKGSYNLILESKASKSGGVRADRCVFL
jgi:proteasome activator subunit 4